ncbi:EXS family protein [Seiridium cupressi]
MKFAKELEQDLVPEWRIKYLNYKAGKKYVKGVTRAINKANATPNLGKRGELPPHATPSYIGSSFTPRRQDGDRRAVRSEEADALSSGRAPMGRGKVAKASGKTPEQPPSRSEPMSVPIRPERQSLTRSPGAEGNYGSFVPTPPGVPSPLTTASRQTFELPGPAMRVPSNTSQMLPEPADISNEPLGRSILRRSVSMLPTTPQLGQSATLPRQGLQRDDSSSSRMRRMFSYGHTPNRPESIKLDHGTQALDTVRQKEKDFFEFLDGELEKVESFYKQKEEQAGQRLDVLRDQLHEMRNRRAAELAEVRRQKEGENGRGNEAADKPQHHKPPHTWMDPIKSKIFEPGPNSRALLKMVRTPVLAGMDQPDERRDYVRRVKDHEVPYRTAKRKLKLALQEFYRGLELLKSYTLLNRTAFRKLNKKYDKAVNARPPYKYMNEKVNKAWFVNSDVLDGHIKAVEDLYARYFEKGNHKIAAGKLRRLTRKPTDESGSTFLTGVFLGTGGVFTLQGLIYGAQLLFDDDPIVRQQTSYLMQIYGGYFLMMYLFTLFCIDCSLWNTYKVNYPFIFEFDPRHNLDWRQLAQFPSFCLLLFGIFIWLNFTRYGSPEMYLYYPVVLIFITMILVLIPAPILAHRSRKWFAYSHWRLFFAGLYPVEFRDFFLGDMYCSLTYATCNVELFFCLYAHYWNNPDQCNSTHSRLLGFFSALPPIWRALQCVRRYADTKNVFPHLVNCGKYCMTIMAAVTLSLYRIDGNNTTLALFATFSVVNSIYCSVWDLFMDFSFLQPDSRHRFLRDILAIKKRWLYYVIMVVDPILRFSWIFYAIFTHDKQHSTVASFLIGFAEVTRRGMWALFRVENEHCSNVAQYKASRDVPLPYKLDLEPLIERPSEDTARPKRHSEEATATAVDPSTAGRASRIEEQAASSASPAAQTAEESGVRRRRKSEALSGGGMIRRIMADAHRQDFEKKRKPREPPKESDQDLQSDGQSEDDDDDEDDDSSASVLGERMEVRQAEHLVRGAASDDEL